MPIWPIVKSTAVLVTSSTPPIPQVNSLSPTHGTDGASVAIAGVYFTGATAVYFGGIPAASYSVGSDTSITATAPTGVGSGPVTVRTPSGVGGGPWFEACGGSGVALSSLAVSPNPIVAFTGATTQLTATGTFSDSSTENLTSAVTWASSDQTVTTVSSGSGGGLLTGVAVGTANVTASLGAVTSPGVTATISSAVRTQRIRMVTPYSIGVIGVNFSQWLPQWLPPDAANVKLLLSNRNVAQAANDGPSVSGINVAIYKSNGLGSPTGSALISWTNQTVPTGTSDLSLTLTGFDPATWRGVDGKIIVAIGVPSGLTVSGNTNITQGLRNTSSATVSSIPALSQSDSSLFCVSLIVDTAVAYLVGMGDSLSQGYNPSHSANGGFVGSWLTQFADHGVVVDNNGIPGSTLQQWNDSAGRPYYKLGQTLSGRKVVVALSINDLNTLSGATDQAKANDFLSRVSTMIAYLQTGGVASSDIYWVNLTASSTYAAYDSIRLLINSGLVTQLGSAHVIDAAALADNGTALKSQFDDEDGTHWNRSLHDLVSSAAYSKIYP